jgi:uncharacterized glyoxalase superfamily protein PhnB
MSDSKTHEDTRSEPQSLRLRSIGVSLTVDDLEASVRWYRDVLGFTVVDEWEDEGRPVGVALIAGAARVILSRDDGVKGWNRAKGQGLRLYLNTAQDVDRLAENIVARGGTLESVPADMPWGSRVFSLVDPDGFQLSVSSGE